MMAVGTKPEPVVKSRRHAVRRGNWALFVHESAEKGVYKRELVERVEGVNQARSISDEAEEAQALEIALQSWLAGGEMIESSRIHLDSETVEKLRALGYAEAQ